MELIKSDIRTVNTGMCASMGSVLLGAGTKGKRASLRFSQVMTHQVSFGASGNVMDVRITTKEAEKSNFILAKMLAQYSNRSFEEYINTVNRDKWYSSSEALKFGLIDEVIETKTSSIDELMEGFDDYYINLLKIQK